MDLLDFFVDNFSLILVAAVLLIFIAGMIIPKLTGNPLKGKIHPVGFFNDLPSPVHPHMPDLSAESDNSEEEKL